MININKVDSIPQNAVKSKKGELTKKIYICGDEIKPNGFNNTSYIFAKNSIEEILFENSYENRNYISTYAIIKNNGNTIKKETISNIDGYNLTVYGNFIIETEEPVEILRENSFYYIPYNPIELKPMPKIDKLIDSSTFENVSTKLQEINNLLKVSSDNLKTIMDANNLMYETTDNFSTLVKKLNSEPINFLLEGTKVRDILNKHLGATTYAPEVGSSYCYVCFTNIKRQSWTDLKEDLSLKKDGSISLYHELVDKSDRNYHNYYYIYSENKIYANKDSSYIFNTKKNGFKSIDFENIYFDYVENASYMFYNFGEGYGTGIFNINNLKLKNAKNINYIFNGSNIGNINFVVYDKMESYSNFSPKYSTITLDYVNDKSKKIAESIIASNNNLKLGTLVTQ